MSNKTLSGAGPAVPPVPLANPIEPLPLHGFVSGMDFSVEPHGEIMIRVDEPFSSSMGRRARVVIVAEASFAAPPAPGQPPEQYTRPRSSTAEQPTFNRQVEGSSPSGATATPAQPLSPPAEQGRQEEQLSGEGVEAALVAENTRLHHEVSLRNSELIHIATGNWRLPCGCSAGLVRTVACGQTQAHRVGNPCGQVVKAQLEAARASDNTANRQPAPLPEKQSPPPAPPADPEGAMREAIETIEREALTFAALGGEWHRGYVRGLENARMFLTHDPKWRALAHPPADSAGAGRTSERPMAGKDGET